MCSTSSQQNAVSAEGLFKTFEIAANPWQSLLHDFLPGTSSKMKKEVALDNITFQVESGEIFGIIGRNGSGKTTLLRILAGTLLKSSGTMKISGRIAAVLDVDAGFVPELSGKENLRLAAPLAGFRPGEIEDLIDRISQFSELGEALNHPVKTYSMGMMVRLGFSLAIHQPFDVLLVDEVLSVGDAGFAAKCVRKIRELAESGKSIVVASHNLGVIAGLCRRALVLSKGKEVFIGDVNDAIGAYWKLVEKETGSISTSTGWRGRLMGDGRAEIEDVRFSHETHEERRPQLISGKPCTVNILIKVHSPINNAVARIQWFRNDGYLASGHNSSRVKIKLNLNPGRHSISIHYPSLGLLQGDYYVNTGIWPDEYSSFASGTPVATRSFGDIVRIVSTIEQGAGVSLNEGHWTHTTLEESDGEI